MCWVSEYVSVAEGPVLADAGGKTRATLEQVRVEVCVCACECVSVSLCVRVCDVGV